MEPPASTPYEVGASVIALDGEVGTVEEIVTDPATGEPSLLAVRSLGGGRLEIPFGLLDPAASDAGTVRLAVARDGLTPVGAADAATGARLEEVGDRIVVPVREEVLDPSTHEVEAGVVRIHKRVETVPVETTVDAMIDDVLIERVAVNRPVATAPSPRHEGQTLVIPVVEEVLVTEKRLMLKEEIRVTRRKVAKPVEIRDTVRREVVEIEEPAGGNYQANPESPRGSLPLRHPDAERAADGGDRPTT